MAKLKKTFIDMPHPNGPLSVEGYPIGQLAVYKVFSAVQLRDYWEVAHSASGCYIARYYKQADAVAFAKQAQEIFDFDAYVVALASDGLTPDWKAAMADMKLLRESLPSYVREHDGEDVRDATVEYLKGLVNAQSSTP